MRPAFPLYLTWLHYSVCRLPQLEWPLLLMTLTQRGDGSSWILRWLSFLGHWTIRGPVFFCGLQGVLWRLKASTKDPIIENCSKSTKACFVSHQSVWLSVFVMLYSRPSLVPPHGDSVTPHWISVTSIALLHITSLLSVVHSTEFNLQYPSSMSLVALSCPLYQLYVFSLPECQLGLNSSPTFCLSACAWGKKSLKKPMRLHLFKSASHSGAVS